MQCTVHCTSLSQIHLYCVQLFSSKVLYCIPLNLIHCTVYTYNVQQMYQYKYNAKSPTTIKNPADQCTALLNSLEVFRSFFIKLILKFHQHSMNCSSHFLGIANLDRQEHEDSGLCLFAVLKNILNKIEDIFMHLQKNSKLNSQLKAQN